MKESQLDALLSLHLGCLVDFYSFRTRPSLLTWTHSNPPIAYPGCSMDEITAPPRPPPASANPTQLVHVLHRKTGTGPFRCADPFSSPRNPHGSPRDTGSCAPRRGVRIGLRLAILGRPVGLFDHPSGSALTICERSIGRKAGRWVRRRGKEFSQQKIVFGTTSLGI